MASTKAGYGLPAKPSDGYRPQRSDDGVLHGSIPRQTNRLGQKDAYVPRSGRQASSPPAIIKIAQPHPIRGLVLPRPPFRPAADIQAVSLTVGNGTSSETSRLHYQKGSGSSSSGRSMDSTSRTGQQVSHKRYKASAPCGIGPIHMESASSSSSNPSNLLQGASARRPQIQRDRELTGSPAGVPLAGTLDGGRSLAHPPVIYPELDRYRDFQRPEYVIRRPEIDVPYRLATQNLPPPTPISQLLSGDSSQVSAMSASPSTKFSESPGPGSYSRDTTPTSMSSQSPVFVAPSRVGIPPRNVRQLSLSTARPPVTKRRAGSFPDEGTVDPHGLASVRESLTSSSSNSTMKDGDRAVRKAKAKARHLSPPAPSPPPRRSSQKFRNPKNGSDGSNPPKPRISEPRDVPDETKPSSATCSSASSPPRTRPPTRPSRRNTPVMNSQLFSHVPVIQNNLTSAMRFHEGHVSGSLVTTSLPGSTTSIPPTPRTVSSSTASLGHESISTSPIARSNLEKQRGYMAELSSLDQVAQPRSTSSSRGIFPFFGRKKTTSNDTKQNEGDYKRKLGRKGPVAGTGHEGYGCVGAVRRRNGCGSVFPQGVTDPVSSCDSLTSDSFLTDRMHPVIISGGEVVENRNASAELSRSETNQSMPGRPSIDSNFSSEGSSTSYNESRPGISPSTLPHPQTSSHRQPSDGAGPFQVGMESTLAFRRSVQRLRSCPDSPLRLPQPLTTSSHLSSPPLTSLDPSILSDGSHSEMTQTLSQESSRRHIFSRKLQKRTRSPRKWNLFSRSQSQPITKIQTSENIQATVKVVDKRPVAFYTIMDTAEQDRTGLLDIHEVLRQAEVYGQTSIAEDRSYIQAAVESSKQLMADSPTKKAWQASSDGHSITTFASSPGAETHAQTPTSEPNNNSSRPSRLQQVGRIPQVIKQRTNNSSPQSFSRPFRGSLQHPIQTAAGIYDPEFIATGTGTGTGPLPETSSTTVPELNREGLTLGTDHSSCRNSFSKISPDMARPDRDFLSFSPRKNSDGTVYTSSSSSGGANPFFLTATAVIPKPEDPPVEDEIWDEYDDLLGDEAMKRPWSATSSKGVPLHLETYQQKIAKEKDDESPTVAVDGHETSTYSRAPAHSSSYSADMKEPIRAAFQVKTTSPVSGTSGSRVRGEQASGQMGAVGASASRRDSSSSCRTTFSECISCSSNDESPLAQVNLRVGSMTVSKWLTFGHVLFSDIRHELAIVKNTSIKHSILVIDGLGNDDWSFYAAETYPATSFFNLSPRAPLPAELKNSSAEFPLSPVNHHQVQYTSHLEKFPFAPQSFDAVVYRFPMASSEAHYRNILSEARRVLRPDGYIELSVLESDLNNMGHRSRRTIRQLKERIQQKRPDATFTSTADLVVRLLGKAGFSDIKAARVGVPVASSITRSVSQGAKGKHGSDKKSQNTSSLAEIMRDNSPLADANITKIVTRVGRWWYTRCYESASGVGSNASIWNDKELLFECEQLGTSLKFMVCCARAPERIASF